MRHNKKFNHLSRKKGHRDAMLANMTISLIMHKRIFTTLPKAKALRVYAEPIINRAKTDDTASRRVVFSYLQNKQAVSILFNEIAQKIADRPGGYTRILKMGNRLGDNAKTCFIELVDYNEALLAEKKRRLPRRQHDVAVALQAKRPLRLLKKRLPHKKLLSNFKISATDPMAVISHNRLTITSTASHSWGAVVVYVANRTFLPIVFSICKSVVYFILKILTPLLL